MSSNLKQLEWRKMSFRQLSPHPSSAEWRQPSLHKARLRSKSQGCQCLLVGGAARSWAGCHHPHQSAGRDVQIQRLHLWHLCNSSPGIPVTFWSHCQLPNQIIIMFSGFFCSALHDPESLFPLFISLSLQRSLVLRNFHTFPSQFCSGGPPEEVRHSVKQTPWVCVPHLYLFSLSPHLGSLDINTPQTSLMGLSTRSTQTCNSLAPLRSTCITPHSVSHSSVMPCFCLCVRVCSVLFRFSVTPLLLVFRFWSLVLPLSDQFHQPCSLPLPLQVFSLPRCVFIPCLYHYSCELSLIAAWIYL